ncbi:MAG TPA: SUMF1/EgtB/PvdO family nonheme iron enzyme [Planctomycetota bacterium]|nr:SUMF1/EgtB/PvdO family nonheme iron enzyme [Planctomycetota bacterium]
MNDPVDSGPRRRVWPLAAMAVLIGLLATFLIVQFTRPQDDTPVTVAPPPPPPQKTPPAAPEADPADKLLEEAGKALKEGRWDEAVDKANRAKGTRAQAAAALLARIEEARKTPVVPENPAAAEEDRKRREAAAAQEKARRDRETALAELDRIVMEAREQADANKWDAALAVFDNAVKTYPALAGIEDFVSSRRQIEKLRQDAATAFLSAIERSKAEAKAGRFAAAVRTARMAGALYPENSGVANQLKDISKQMLETNLVLVSKTIEGGVKLGDPKRPDEPVRTFTSPGFLMDKYEVTNEEYYLFVLLSGHRAPPSPMWSGGEPRAGFERHPVTHVAVSDAEAFAAWAGKRLPSEDEWEYAARWSDGRTYPWGSTEPQDQHPVCQSLEASRASNPNQMPGNRPVGSWPESASLHGIHDLAGSVWEWTSTPLKGLRIQKGGSFLAFVTAARASNRLADDPELLHPDVGFRCVKDRP